MTPHIDMMHVNEVRFVTSTSHPMCHCGCSNAAQNDAETFHEALDEILWAHNKGGHCIKTIKRDHEFQSTMEDIADNSGVEMNHANTQDHAAAAEQNDHTIEASMQTAHHRSGCATTPKQMIIALAEHSVKQLNVFPAKHGISECCSPETIVTG